MASLNIVDLIIKKRDNKALSKHEIEFLVKEIVTREIQDAQLGALLMAIYLRDMKIEEITDLTRATMLSGETFIGRWDSESWRSLVVDKHSTGGVGDKTSLALAPALAALGLKVPMISGRGLEHTGGTLDKLEAIPGYKVEHSIEDIHRILQDTGCCIVAQTSNLVPADKIMYATRDVTGTVANKALACASIVSKKAAEDPAVLVLDVKFGNGAFFEELDTARDMAQTMVDVCNRLGPRTTALLSRMDNPVGKAVGNSLEVIEAIETLHGRGPADFVELVASLGSELLVGSRRADNRERGRQMMAESLQNGTALKRFKEMLIKQGVVEYVAERLCTDGVNYDEIMRPAKQKTKVASDKAGHIKNINALKIGKFSHALGAGRKKMGEAVNHAVGVMLLKQPGDYVAKGDDWIEVHHDSEQNGLSDNDIQTLDQALELQDEPLSEKDTSLVAEIVS